MIKVLRLLLIASLSTALTLGNVIYVTLYIGFIGLWPTLALLILPNLLISFVLLLAVSKW